MLIVKVNSNDDSPNDVDVYPGRVLVAWTRDSLQLESQTRAGYFTRVVLDNNDVDRLIQVLNTPKAG